MTQEIQTAELAEVNAAEDAEDVAAEQEGEQQAEQLSAASPAAPEPARRELPKTTPPSPPSGQPQPSWFLSASGEQLTREELLARYRRHRELPDDPFERGARPTPPPGYRDRIMGEPRPVRFVERAAQAEAPPPKPQRTFTIGQTFAIAAAMAVVAGGGAGVMSARLSGWSAGSPAPALPAATAANPAPVADAAPVAAPQQLRLAGVAPANATVIDKKPIATATLQVADVTGETNSLIPLSLHADPGGPDKDMLLKISGVPEGAYLTSGHREDDQIWALSLAETKNVKLVVPQASDPQIDLAVAAFEPKTGELAAPVKTLTVALKDVVVEPTSAPPPDQTASAPAPAKAALPGAAGSALPAPIMPPQTVSATVATSELPETQQLIGKASAFLATGDVKAARKSYERAWGNDGSAAAAFGLARSYDPLVLASLAGGNAQPDRNQAIQWYQRAASGGNPDAAEAIIRLQMKP